jgi:hypothetical protein
MKTYDLVIIGTGLAGAIAAVTAAEGGLSVLSLEKGLGPKDRRSLVHGWFGQALYTMSRIDIDQDGFTDEVSFEKALEYCRKANGGRLELHQTWEVMPGDLPLQASGKSHYKASANCGSDLANQTYQRLITTGMADVLFGTVLERIEYNGKRFILYTSRGKLEAKKCLLATGIYSAEWIQNVCNTFSLPLISPNVRIGIRVEVPARLLRTFLQVAGDLQLAAKDVLFNDMRQNSLIGERDDDGLLSAFAYTLPGRNSERTSFMASFDAKTDLADAIRLTRIINVLSNDKIRRERATDFIQGHSVLEHLEQFKPIKKALIDLNKMIPSFLGCAFIHIPEIRIGGTLPVDENMKTAFAGLYGAGGCVTRVASPLGTIASALVAVRNLMEELND